VATVFSKKRLVYIIFLHSAKYPLAVVEHLLKVLPPGLGAGYDCGCKFATTLDRSPLGPQAREKRFKSLVGLFHGHAHNRLCQLSNLGTYVKGMGLEDLEGCERLFRRTNGMAGGFRYASAFHRRQSLAQYFQHLDRYDTYESLSEFFLLITHIVTNLCGRHLLVQQL
jgi:hypothetical protein